MNKVAIISDSNSGITQKEAKDMGVFILPMPFLIDGVEYFEDITLSQEDFYKMLKSDVDVQTSQPSIKAVTELWDRVLREYDEAVYIPMSSGLSGACETAYMLAKDYNGRVKVIDNQRISHTMRRSVDTALGLSSEGRDASYIEKVLTETKLDASIYITLDTLKYLKKGGRLTPAAAAIGTILRIKPVLQIQGGRLDAYTKARTMKSAKEAMIRAIQNDLETRLGYDVDLDIAHTDNYDEALKFKDEVIEAFPMLNPKDIRIGSLSLSVSCHIGEGSLALLASKKI